MYKIASGQHLSSLCQIGKQSLCMDKECACHAHVTNTQYLLSKPTVTTNFLDLAHDLWESRVARSETMSEVQVQRALIDYLAVANKELEQQGYSPFNGVDLDSLVKVMTDIVAMEMWVLSEATRRFTLAMDRKFLEFALPQH